MKRLITSVVTIISFILVFRVWLTAPSSEIKKNVNKVEKKSGHTIRKATSHSNISKKLDISKFKLTERQKDIVNNMMVGKKYTMGFFEEKFSEVHVRTLRRDLDKLQKTGLIGKSGSTKAASYQKI